MISRQVRDAGKCCQETTELKKPSLDDVSKSGHSIDATRSRTSRLPSWKIGGLTAKQEPVLHLNGIDLSSIIYKHGGR
jgi:hypothetical protein